MVTDHRALLSSIKRFDQLIAYLRDEMGWPISQDSFEKVDDLFYDFTPDELGIDPETAAKIVEIKRLRPLSARQPWGIFFVKFEPKRLPVVALRRILNRVAHKKRSSANSADRRAWAADDLLFISNYGEDHERRISFAHFSQPAEGGDLPTLRVLGWDDRDTALHLDGVAEELTRTLAWPRDESNVEDWRSRWSSAFTLGHREIITTSKELARRLAELARGIRSRVHEALEVESEDGPVSRLMSAFREGLIHDLDQDGFADMYAQTVAYGLLSARLANPSGRTRDNKSLHIPVTNPFLKELLAAFLGFNRGEGAGAEGIDFDELGLGDVIELLDTAKMEAIVLDFGDRNPQEDPVIHFYESFLKEYDAQKRLERGVFYTPRPIVAFIVNSVHLMLQTEFGLPDGLADVTTWGEMTARVTGLIQPPDVNGKDPFVTILDPATGTGTFLVEVIDVIHRTLLERWRSEGQSTHAIDILWNEYVPQSLLPRIFGYELMVAPYAIAHVKIGLKLYETGYRFASKERARVFLTNSLEPASTQVSLMVPALAREARAVNSVKSHQRFTVIIGNPPYSISSWNTSTWITELAEDYKRTVRGTESQIQALSNDYIKFLRFGESEIEKSSTGVLGLITGHGYLQGTQSRDLRRHLSETFDRVYCVDLHGSVRRAVANEKDDEPVFQIMTGVAIIVALRVIAHKPEGSTALMSQVGSMASKFAFLENGSAPSSMSLVPFIRPAPPNYYFAPSTTDPSVAKEFAAFVDLPELFGTGNRSEDKEVYWATGFSSQQDELAISFEREELVGKMVALASSRSSEELGSQYHLCSTDQWDYISAKQFAAQGKWRSMVERVAYRPFDDRWTVFDRNIVTITRMQVMSQLRMKTGENLALITSRAVNDLSFAHCFVTNKPTDKIFISSKSSTNAYVFPAYFGRPQLGDANRKTNFSRVFLTGLGSAIGLRLDDASGLPSGITAEDIFHYIYAILHSPTYRARYTEPLKTDFPRIPIPRDTGILKALGDLGAELVALHLMVSPKLERAVVRYRGPSNPVVEKVAYSEGTIWVDRGHDCGFSGVNESVWAFHVGGYQVCEKWLKDRKGRRLSDEDRSHYIRIVTALDETTRLMAKIDDAIQMHGGWPEAFHVADDLAVRSARDPGFGGQLSFGNDGKMKGTASLKNWRKD